MRADLGGMAWRIQVSLRGMDETTVTQLPKLEVNGPLIIKPMQVPHGLKGMEWLSDRFCNSTEYRKLYGINMGE